MIVLVTSKECSMESKYRRFINDTGEYFILRAAVILNQFGQVKNQLFQTDQCRNKFIVHISWHLASNFERYQGWGGGIRH